jgi:hypothetical protein
VIGLKTGRSGGIALDRLRMITTRAGIGFVGLDKAAGRRADAALTLTNGASLAACSSDKATAEACAARHGIARVYSRYVDMLAVDAIAGVVDPLGQRRAPTARSSPASAGSGAGRCSLGRRRAATPG